jgi:hypothetical protein
MIFPEFFDRSMTALLRKWFVGLPDKKRRFLYRKRVEQFDI